MAARRSLRSLLREAGGVLLAVTVILVPLVAFAAVGGLTNPIEGGCNNLGECIARLVRAVLALVAVVALGFIVYGGFLYMTAAGNDDQIKQGKQAVTGAIVGIIVVGLAYAIVEFVARALGAGGPGGGGL